MEADNVHSTIEGAMKKRVINVRKNPRAYDVKFLDYKFFQRILQRSIS